MQMVKFMQIIAKPFIYLRHGETDWNKQRIAMGQSDIPLNEHGVAQAHAATEKLLPYQSEIELICTSPLKRTKDTANIVANKINVPIIEIPELMEINLGDRQGTSFLESNWMEEWQNGLTPANAESYDQFVERFINGLNIAINRPEKVLIVSHGLAFIQVSRKLMDQELFLPNCAPVRCLPQNNGTFNIEIMEE